MDVDWTRAWSRRGSVAWCGDVIHRQRAEIVPWAAGQVLELGIGTGDNLPFYDTGRVTTLIGMDASNARLAATRLKAADLAIPVQLYPHAGIRLPLDTDSIDTIVITDNLCRMPDIAAGLAELRRVLKPTGRLLFCERGKSPDAPVARWQQRLAPSWRWLTGGCHLDRDIPALLHQNGFVLEAINARYLPGRPRVFGFTYWGAATIA